MIAGQGWPVTFDESGSTKQRATGTPEPENCRGHESRDSVKEQVEPRPVSYSRPKFQLMGQDPKPRIAIEQILEFRGRSRHSPGYLVASDSGEYDAVPLRFNAIRKLPVASVSGQAPEQGVCREKVGLKARLKLSCELTSMWQPVRPRFSSTCCEIRPLVPIGFGVVEIGNGIETNRIGGSAGHFQVGHAYDGRGIHSSTQLGEDWPIGTQPAPYGLGECRPKVIFVFSVGLIADSFCGVEIPIFLNGLLQSFETHK